MIAIVIVIIAIILVTPLWATVTGFCQALGACSQLFTSFGCSGVRAVWVLCSGFRLKLRRI